MGQENHKDRGEDGAHIYPEHPYDRHYNETALGPIPYRRQYLHRHMKSIRSCTFAGAKA